VRHSLKLAPKESLAAQATQRIRNAIADGEFALGEMIPEESLAKAMGVSRTPVREALNELQRMGLVTIKPQRGSYVFEPTESDIAEICDYRRMLETQAARSAFLKKKDACFLALSNAVEQMEHSQKNLDKVAYGHADTQFHDALFEHCDNAYLRAAYELVSSKIAALRTQLTAPFDDLRIQSLEEHRVFLNLFQVGDFLRFEDLMREHVDRTCDVFTNAWVKRQQVLSNAAAKPK